MQNHADQFQPPEGQTPLGDAKGMFQFVSAVLMMAVHIVAAFWAMVAKKPGTVGTRAYWFDVGCANTLLLALSQNWWYPDRFLFQAAIPLLTGLYVWHLIATLRRNEHVHTRCVGSSRFGSGDDGKFKEALAGLATGGCICLTGCLYFGAFVAASAIANAMRILMVDERDRQRSVQMADAFAEQEFMMHQYEQFQREKAGK